MANVRRHSRIPTFEQAIEIWEMLLRGLYQHDIAAALGLNQGRISEVKTGKRHPEARKLALLKWQYHGK